MGEMIYLDQTDSRVKRLHSVCMDVYYMNMGSYNCCSSGTKNSRKVASLTSVLKIVAEENRLQLLCIMKDGGHCVCELMDHVDQSQSLISHHLRDLKDAGIVKDKKKGLRVYYSLTAKGKRIVDTLFTL